MDVNSCDEQCDHQVNHSCEVSYLNYYLIKKSVSSSCFRININYRYNGELIQQGLKAVEPIKRVANYEYGAVNNDATPVLATFLLLSVALAALVWFYIVQ